MDDRNIKAYSNKRWYDDPEGTIVICSKCKRLPVEKVVLSGTFFCSVYPDGIPEKILDFVDGESAVPACYEPKEQ